MLPLGHGRHEAVLFGIIYTTRPGARGRLRLDRCAQLRRCPVTRNGSQPHPAQSLSHRNRTCKRSLVIRQGSEKSVVGATMS